MNAVGHTRKSSRIRGRQWITTLATRHQVNARGKVKQDLATMRRICRVQALQVVYNAEIASGLLKGSTQNDTDRMVSCMVKLTSRGALVVFTLPCV